MSARARAPAPPPRPRPPPPPPPPPPSRQLAGWLSGCAVSALGAVSQCSRWKPTVGSAFCSPAYARDLLPLSLRGWSVEAGGCRLRRCGVCLDGRPGEVRLNCLPARCWLAEARTAQAGGTGADVLPATPSLALTRRPRPRSLPCCFAVASGAFMCVLWALRLQPVPQVSWADIKALAPVGYRRLAMPSVCHCQLVCTDKSCAVKHAEHRSCFVQSSACRRPAQHVLPA